MSIYSKNDIFNENHCVLPSKDIAMTPILEKKRLKLSDEMLVDVPTVPSDRGTALYTLAPPITRDRAKSTSEELEKWSFFNTNVSKDVHIIPGNRHDPPPLTISTRKISERSMQRARSATLPLNYIHEVADELFQKLAIAEPLIPESNASFVLNVTLSRQAALGQGRYATVFRGLCWPTGDTQSTAMSCAVKRFQDDEAQSCHDEIFILRKIRHLPFIIHLIAVVDAKTASWIDPETPMTMPPQKWMLVLPLCVGSLMQFIEESPTLLTAERFVQYAFELASALAAVHERNIIHHDIKPHNILLTEENHICLSDFGNALEVNLNALPTDGLGRGTTQFTAPEILSPGKPYSFGVDVYSFGATLYTLLTGLLPFASIKYPAALMTAIKRGFVASSWNPMPVPGAAVALNGAPIDDICSVAWILHATQREPEKRPSMALLKVWTETAFRFYKK